MADNNNQPKAKLTLTLIGVNGQTVERFIEGAGNIAYILYEAGILDDELEAVLGHR